MKPELQNLFEGVNGIAPEFLDKISNLLESKVEAARATAIQETEAAGHQERLALVESHQAAIAALKESHIQEVAAKVDSFINAVVEEWANKNAPAIDAKIKVEAAERFMTGFASVLKEAGVNFATDESGQIAALTARLTEAERLNESQGAELKTLKESDQLSKRETVIKRVCEGLVDTKRDTVVNLLEGIEFTTESAFESRVRTFRNLVEGSKEGDDDFKDEVGKDGKNKDKDLKEGKKKVKKEGDDGDDDDDDDDKDDDKDETGKEVNESVRQQISRYLNG